jgi:hypothetical protein
MWYVRGVREVVKMAEEIAVALELWGSGFRATG